MTVHSFVQVWPRFEEPCYIVKVAVAGSSERWLNSYEITLWCKPDGH